MIIWPRIQHLPPVWTRTRPVPSGWRTRSSPSYHTRHPAGSGKVAFTMAGSALFIDQAANGSWCHTPPAPWSSVSTLLPNSSLPISPLLPLPTFPWKRDKCCGGGGQDRALQTGVGDARGQDTGVCTPGSQFVTLEMVAMRATLAWRAPPGPTRHDRPNTETMA